MRDDREESRPYTPIDFNTNDSIMIRWIVRNSQVSAEHQVEAWMNIRGSLKMETIKAMTAFDLLPYQVAIIYTGSTEVKMEVGNLIKKRQIKSGEIINYKRFFLVREAQLADPSEIELANVRLSPTEDLQIIVIDRKSYEDAPFTAKEKIMALHRKPSQRLLSDIPKLMQLIQELPIFSKVDAQSRMGLAQDMVLESYRERKPVFEEGDKGNAFYTIIFGRCYVYMKEKTIEAVKQAVDSRISENEDEHSPDWPFSKGDGDGDDNDYRPPKSQSKVCIVDDSADKKSSLKNNNDDNNNNETAATTMDKSSPASPHEEPVHSDTSQQQDGEEAADGKGEGDDEEDDEEAGSDDKIEDLDRLNEVGDIPDDFKKVKKNVSSTNQDCFSEDYFAHQSLDSSLFELSQKKSRWGERVAILVAGQSFGEMALLNSVNERTATVVADAGVKLARISRESFNKIMMHLERIRMNSEITFLRSAYKGLSFLSQRDAMAQLFSFRRRVLPRGVVLATAGSPANELIIVREGSVLLVDTQADVERTGSRSKSIPTPSTYRNQNGLSFENTSTASSPFLQSAVPVSVVGPTAILGDECLNYVYSKGSMQLLKGRRGTHSFTAITLSATKILTMPQKEALVLIFPSLRNGIRDNGAAVREWRIARSRKAAKIKGNAEDAQGLESSVAAGAVSNSEEGGRDSKRSNAGSRRAKDAIRAGGIHNSKKKSIPGMTLSKISSASQRSLSQVKSGSHRKARELSERPENNRKYLEFLMDCSWSLNHTTFTPS